MSQQISSRPRLPVARRIQARAFRVINVPIRAILGLPFPTPLGRRLMLVTLTGRRTGRIYRQPVSYVRDGETMLTPGGGRWKLNLVAGRAVSIRLSGHDIRATPEIVSEPGEVARLLALIAAGSPVAARFVGVRRLRDGSFDPEQLRPAIDHGFRIVRWHAEPGSGAR